MTDFVDVNDVDYDLLQHNSGMREVDIFIKSPLHEDFRRWIDFRIEQLNVILDDDDLKFSGRQYDQARGGKRFAKEMREFFLEMYEGMQDINNSNEGEEK